jgi:hypothetical protein
MQFYFQGMLLWNSTSCWLRKADIFMEFFLYFIQSNLFFKEENPPNQEKSVIGDLFVSALSLKKTPTTTAPTSTIPTSSLKTTNTRAPSYSQTRTTSGVRSGHPVRSKVCHLKQFFWVHVLYQPSVSTSSNFLL